MAIPLRSAALLVFGASFFFVQATLVAQTTPVPSKPAQSAPNPEDILRRTEARYANLSQFDVASTTTATETMPSGEPATISISTHWSARGANRIRFVEERAAGGQQSSSLVVADGENLWAYSPDLNEYTKKPLAELPARVLNYAVEGVTDYFLAQADESTYLRDERIEVDGAQTDCFVVQIVRGGNRITRWIDKKRFVVLREDQPAGSDPSIGPTRTVWHVTKLNESVPDEVFTFVPPPGAKLVERIQR